MLSFESSGIGSLPRDARSIAFVKKLEAAAPYLGYFLAADPPFFHLREASMTLAASAPGVLTIESFLDAHNRLYDAAVQHCAVVGDKPESLDEPFEVNLVHEVLRSDSKLQRQAMRRLHPALVIAATASPALSKRAFQEAERTWGRTLAEFHSREHFLHEFEKAFK
ncbi:MAG: hypothetical protein QM778_18320 [Myxococcales bacterium]